MKKVFIDGKAGTTGLRIFERLSSRPDIQILTLSDEDRKDAAKRKEMLNNSDISFLCLPDAAARESVSLVENPDTIILDASTAHRTEPDWAYGFPELSPEHLKKVQTGKRIAVPGCHASGFVALVQPLIARGLLAPEVRLTCHSITGYSGGGKSMIAEYEAEDRCKLFDAPRQYALGQQHKHLKEMVKITGLAGAPIFCPIVSDYYSGMCVTVPLFREDLQNAGIEDVRNVYRELYNGPIVRYSDCINENGLISANALSFHDTMQITVEGNEDRILLISRFDNLGKGASGAALQCMNIAMGVDQTTGLAV